MGAKNRSKSQHRHTPHHPPHDCGVRMPGMHGLVPFTPLPAKPWAPADPGASLRGRFGGISNISGEHGPFAVARIVTHDSVRLVGGVRLHALLRDACVRVGDEVGVVFTGWEDESRMFLLYVDPAASGSTATRMS